MRSRARPNRIAACFADHARGAGGQLEPVQRSDCEALAGKSTLNRLEHNSASSELGPEDAHRPAPPGRCGEAGAAVDRIATLYGAMAASLRRQVQDDLGVCRASSHPTNAAPPSKTSSWLLSPWRKRFADLSTASSAVPREDTLSFPIK
jgi:hypothetical protein